MGRTKRTDDQLQVEEVAIFECLIELCGRHAVPAQIPMLPFNGWTADRVPTVFSGPLGEEIADARGCPRHLRCAALATPLTPNKVCIDTRPPTTPHEL